MVALDVRGSKLMRCAGICYFAKAQATALKEPGTAQSAQGRHFGLVGPAAREPESGPRQGSGTQGDSF